MRLGMILCLALFAPVLAQARPIARRPAPSREQPRLKIPRNFDRSYHANRLLEDLKVGERQALDVRRLPKTADRDAFFTSLAAQGVRVRLESDSRDGKITQEGMVTAYSEGDSLNLDQGRSAHWRSIRAITLLESLKPDVFRRVAARDIKLRPVDLEAAIKESGLVDKGIHPGPYGVDQFNDIKFLRENGARLVAVDALFAERGLRGSFLLGNAGESMVRRYPDPAIYGGMVKSLGLVDFHDAYKGFGIKLDEDQHTHKFLSAIARTDRPIVFLVPKSGLGRSYGFTSREYDWLLNHPEMLARTVFAFGAHQLLEPDFADRKALRLHGEFEDAFAQAIGARQAR